jgi:hypothetical protein
MPTYDGIIFRAIGIVTQPEIDWQNRPTFQQVVEFYRHRPVSGSTTTSGSGTPAVASTGHLAATGSDSKMPVLALAFVASACAALQLQRRRRTVRGT